MENDSRTDPHPTATLYRRGGKRLGDVAASLAGLLLLAPLWLPLALVVRVGLGSPILFRQLRAGRDGRPFLIWKFRTMLDRADSAGRPLPDAQRLTALGRFLRRTSLDELPELVNVLLGQMSLVGPRPLLPEYLSRYDAVQARRHEVRPGVTGWAQVNGRNTVGWPERFALDVWYVDHLSPALDLRILLRTVAEVFRGRGVSAEGHATMPRFDQLPERGEPSASADEERR